MARTFLDLDVQGKAGSISNALIAAAAQIAHSKLADTTPGYILLGTTTSGVITATAVSGDVTINGAGAVTIGALKVTNGMLAGSITLAKLDTIGDGKIIVGAATSGNPTAVSMSGDVTISNLGVTTIGSLKVTNGMLAGSITLAKLDTIGDGKIIVGAATSGNPTAVSMSGDVTISNAGVTTIGSLKVTDGMLAGSISSSKLADQSKILFTDANRTLTSGTRISYSTTQSFSSAGDLVTKEYVDGVASGLDVKQSVQRRALATDGTGGNITLSGNTEALDGSVPADGDRVLLCSQTAPAQNGIWVVSSSGAWTRPTDFPVGGSAAGAFTFVESGDTMADTGWVCTSNKGSDVIGTNPLSFSQFSGAGSYTGGTAINISGTTINAKYDNSTVGVDGSNQLYVKNAGITDTQLSTTVSGGSFGSASSVATFTVSNQGRLSAAGSTSIQIAESQVTNLTTDLAAKVAKADYTAKGDILAGTGAGTYSALGLGNNGTVIMADSTVANGVKWATAIPGTWVRETPSGSTPGTNFTLSQTPLTGSLMVYFNGQLLEPTDDYTLSGTGLTMGFTVGAADKLRAIYRY